MTDFNEKINPDIKIPQDMPADQQNQIISDNNHELNYQFENQNSSTQPDQQIETQNLTSEQAHMLYFQALQTGDTKTLFFLAKIFPEINNKPNEVPFII